eukprot:gene24343-biopygen14943
MPSPRPPHRSLARGQEETATPASGPRPVRVRFFKFYRASRVRSASAAVSPRGVCGGVHTTARTAFQSRAGRQHVMFTSCALRIANTGPRCIR